MKNIKIILALLYCVSTIYSAKIFIIAQSSYYTHNSAGLLQYKTDVEAEGFTTDYALWTGGSYIDLYNLIKTEYTNARNNPPYDTIKGFVLIGDIPAAPFILKKGLVYPCDYLFMDIWRDEGWTPYPYADITTIWSYDTINTTAINRRSYNYDIGDEKLEVWVSRITGYRLSKLRDVGDAWGTFLHPFEIMDRYFTRLHNRRTQPVNVPRRTMSMGPPPSWDNDRLEAYLGFDSLGLQNFRFSYDVGHPFRLNNAAAWQAQLQNGPMGNTNHGSRFGSLMTDPLYTRNCVSTFTQQGGFEWAGVFAHSTPYNHNFHQYYYAGGSYSVGGSFVPELTADPWVKRPINGGVGSECYVRIDSDNSKQSMVEWHFTLPTGMANQGCYAVYLTKDVNTQNSDDSWYLITRSKSGAGKDGFLYKSDGRVRQGSVTTNYNFLDTVYLNMGDTIVVQLTPHHKGYNPATPRVVADAMVLYKFPFGEFQYTVDETDILDIDNRGAGGFRCNSWYIRSFYNMQDDGGQSKSQFYILNGCQISNFTRYENLGLLYAMGHNGLMAMGNAYDNGHNFRLFTGALKHGANFGEAFKTHSDDIYPDYTGGNYILLGDGTLKHRPYVY